MIIKKFLNQTVLPSLAGEELIGLCLYLEFLLKHNLLIPFTSASGRQYFAFLFNNQVYYISEFALSMLTGITTFSITFSIRYVFHRFQLGSKISKRLKVRTRIQNLKARSRIKVSNLKKKLLSSKKKRLRRMTNKIRGGQEIVNEIVSYEGLPVKDRFLPIVFLTLHEQYLASILIQCFRPDHYYRVTDPNILATIREMLDDEGFKGWTLKGTLRVISYEVFALALTSTKIAVRGHILSWFLNGLSVSTRETVLLLNPVIGTGIAGILFAMGLRLPIPGAERIAGAGESFYLAKQVGNFFFHLLVGHYGGALYRSYIGLECERYVEQLPFDQTISLEQAFNPQAALPQQSSYIRTIQTDSSTILVSTSQNPLYHQLDPTSKVELKTLDGRFTQVTRLNGDQSVDWTRYRDTNKQIAKTYKKLSERTGTIDDILSSVYVEVEHSVKTTSDVTRLDETRVRNAAQRIRDAARFTQKALEVAKEDSLE